MSLKTTCKISLFCLFILLGCKTTNSLHYVSEIPILIEAPYYQSWVAGVQGGGRGVDVFLPVKGLMRITPDSIHFREQRVKAVYKNQMIVGYFSAPQNQPVDVILSNEPFAEAKNQLLPIEDRSALELESNACVLSYTVENKRYYYKITNLTQRPSTPYPTPPPQLRN